MKADVTAALSFVFLVGCNWECPDPPAVLFSEEASDEEPDFERVERVTPEDAEVAGSGATTWTLTSDSTSLRVVFAPEVTFPPPPLTGCCDLRLPASRLSTRTELQIFADDGLWLEISTPRADRATEEMHASLVNDENPPRCNAGDHWKDRFKLLFSFAAEPAGLLESRRGELDGVPVRGIVTRDVFDGDAGETGPQVVIGRTDE